MAAPGVSRINLLPKDSFEFSSLGKILKWTTSVGRVLVVMTEFVVILAFASRFYFDKKLNDLNDQIEGKLAVVQGFAAVETQMREVLQKQSVVAAGLAEGVRVEEKIASLSRIIPAGVTLEILHIEGKKLEMSGRAGSEGAFAQALANFKQAEEIRRVSLGQTYFDQDEGRIVFNIKTEYK